MADGSKLDVGAIRELLAAHVEMRSDGQIRGYGKRARDVAKEYVREQRELGTRLVTIARALGVKSSTVMKWTREMEGPGRPIGSRQSATSGRPSQFVPVSVAASLSPPKRMYTLVSPTGWRLEGLDDEGVRALLGQPR
jgi:hypothetical protein